MNFFDTIYAFICIPYMYVAAHLKPTVLQLSVIFNEPLTFLQRVAEYMEYVYLLHTAASLDDQFLRMQVIGSYLLARNFVKIKKCLTIAKHFYKQLLTFINGLKATVREWCLITYAIFFPLESFMLMTSITELPYTKQLKQCYRSLMWCLETYL